MAPRRREELTRCARNLTEQQELAALRLRLRPGPRWHVHHAHHDPACLSIVPPGTSSGFFSSSFFSTTSPRLKVAKVSREGVSESAL
eukprot:scaffold22799_cov142-Isochrysis_galbana.AAC.1